MNKKKLKKMNCATIVPEQEHNRTFEKDRRTSRGLTSCLRGERDEVEGRIFFYFIIISFRIYSFHI